MAVPRIDYATLKQTAEDLIASAGMDGAILRATAGTGGDPWNPSTNTGGSAAPHACKVVLIDFTHEERAGGQIAIGDKRALVSTRGLTIDPVPGDRLYVLGRQHAIRNSSPLNPGGTVLLYDMQVAA